MEAIIFTGALDDPRSEEQKMMDWTHHEMLGGSTGPVWSSTITRKILSKRFQSVSSSCGGQAPAKGYEFVLGIINSANPVYRRRSNYPDPGMYMQEIGSLSIKGSAQSEHDSPSQGMDDPQMNAVPKPGDLPSVFSSYYFIPAASSTDMDVIAHAMDQGHIIIYLVNSNRQEWSQVPVFSNTPVTFSHFICSVPTNYLLYKGEKSVIIDDSCNPETADENGQRILTESFLKARCTGIMALVPSKLVAPPSVRYSLSQNLSYGTMGSDQVKNLQDMLKADGDMSTSVPSTGNFLSATLAAVNAFQQKYADEVLIPGGLTKPTGYVGQATRKKLQQLFM